MFLKLVGETYVQNYAIFKKLEAGFDSARYTSFFRAVIWTIVKKLVLRTIVLLWILCFSSHALVFSPNSVVLLWIIFFDLQASYAGGEKQLHFISYAGLARTGFKWTRHHSFCSSCMWTRLENSFYLLLLICIFINCYTSNDLKIESRFFRLIRSQTN